MTATFTVGAEGPLLPFLFEKLPEVKRMKVRLWLKYEGVEVNGVVVVRSDHTLYPGDILRLTSKVKPPQGPSLLAGMGILYEDDAILVIEKPAGLLSIATDTGQQEATAYSKLIDYVRRDRRDRKSRVWIVHRLDRETSGLMVFARNEVAKRTLQDNWNLAEKRYLAVSDGKPPGDSGVLRSHLDESHAFFVRSTSPSEKTREAITHYRLLRSTPHRSLFELTLETGRRHQIRVQLAEIHCPIVGDSKYNSSAPAKQRMTLHATSLSFPHPETGEILSFESPLPREMERMME
jgi:23S rRNA pseudouridine1911/1915/1917 synthase